MSMDRRKYLSAAAAALAGLAGCTSSSDDNPTTQRTTSTPTPQPTPTTTQTPTDTPTDTATETETTTTTEETTSAAKQAAANAISNAQAALIEALKEYTDNDGTDLTAVTAATSSFRQPDVNEVLSETQSAVSTAREKAVTDTQTETAAHLNGIRWFIYQSMNAQAPLIEAYSALQNADSALQREDTGGAESALSTLRSQVQNAIDPVNALEDEGSPGDAAALDALLESEYSAKVDQLASERETVSDAGEYIQSMIQGVSTLGSARSAFDSEAYSDAAADADKADQTLTEASEHLEELADDASYSVDDGISGLAETASEKATAASDLHRESLRNMND